MKSKTFADLLESLKRGIKNLKLEEKKFGDTLCYSQYLENKAQEYMEFILVTSNFKSDDSVQNVVKFLKAKYTNNPSRLRIMLSLTYKGEEYFKLDKKFMKKANVERKNVH